MYLKLFSMKYKDFSSEIWRQIKNAIQEEKRLNPQPVAAFDADGTLWDIDLGETFFKHQIKNNLLPDVFSSPKTDPWRHYRDWKESGDPRPAYLWLAQINEGYRLEQILSWAEDNVRQFKPFPFFPDQQKLIELLHNEGCHVYVVTASVKWSVEPGAALYKIPPERVLGVKTRVINGVITDQQEGEITYREGKLKALLEATGGVKPFLSSGNSTGDVHLLQAATRIPLAVRSAHPGHELFSVEESLEQMAKEKNWLIHHF